MTSHCHKKGGNRKFARNGNIAQRERFENRNIFELQNKRIHKKKGIKPKCSEKANCKKYFRLWKV